MIMPPRFPVLWLTVLVFGIVAAATRDMFVGGVLLAVVLPVVLLGQWFVRWIFGRFRSPVWLRRGAMLLPALVLAFGLFHATNFSGRQTAAVTTALAGHTPNRIRDLHVQESSWTDYVVFAYFRCDPGSLREILEQPPFARRENETSTLSFAQTPFPDLHGRPDAQGVIVFKRADIELVNGWCNVYTDFTFSFAYITYAVD